MIIAAGVILALLVLWSFSQHGSTNAEGATTQKVIDGFVYDQGSQPVIGANVHVEIWGGYWPDRDILRTSQSTTTDFSGHYEVTIDANYWSPHNTIWVFANDGLYQGEVKVEADGESSQTVDVSLVQVIPEFSIPMGTVSIGMVASLMLFRRVARTRM